MHWDLGLVGCDAAGIELGETAVGDVVVEVVDSAGNGDNDGCDDGIVGVDRKKSLRV